MKTKVSSDMLIFSNQSTFLNNKKPYYSDIKVNLVKSLFSDIKTLIKKDPSIKTLKQVFEVDGHSEKKFKHERDILFEFYDCMDILADVIVAN